ncbi:hypothetical protein HMSSN036_68960 [Paenibacillus macerans]|nr:hypothetical protein HMSSN036_68960 [Paenibacillus macerans]
MIGVLLYLGHRFSWVSWVGWILAGLAVLEVPLMIWSVFIQPSMKYARWRYAISEQFLQLKYGILTETGELIPMTKIQAVATRQGPLQKKVRGLLGNGHDDGGFAYDSRPGPGRGQGTKKSDRPLCQAERGRRMSRAKRYHPFVMLLGIWNLGKNAIYFFFFLFVLKAGSDAAWVKYGRLALLVLAGISLLSILWSWLTRRYQLDDTSFRLYQGVSSSRKE